jgi:DNA-directed RNA polymerase subunit RPC12/RpoP
MRRVLVSLPGDLVEVARQAGEGQVSTGIRKLLEEKMERGIMVITGTSGFWCAHCMEELEQIEYHQEGGETLRCPKCGEVFVMTAAEMCGGGE